MEIFIFILVIVALIIVHEFGHFVVAKWSGMRVDEFGLGYPPRAMLLVKKGGTEYTLNCLPFGGFVKIFGEDGLTSEQEAGAGGRDPRAFGARPRILQALVLVAGIAMNLLFAYILITGALIAGTPRALEDSEVATAKNVELAVANVLPGSPAALGGILPGDVILDAESMLGSWNPNWSATTPKAFSSFVSESNGTGVEIQILRNGKTQKLPYIMPQKGIVTDDPSRYALGVEVATIGVIPLSFGSAIVQGASLTWGAISLTAVGLIHFFYGVFTLTADLSQVSGPVGIAGVVGGASAQGIGYLFSIMAIISINLALINLIPIPALDGGRLLFVIIESIIRRPIKPTVARAMNSVGFVALVLLMLVVTANDIFKIIG